MEPWTRDWIVLTMRCHVVDNDMDGILHMLADDRYRPELGLEAIGVGMSTNRNDIVYELLRFKNTFTIYKKRRSPFMVTNELEKLMMEYVPMYRRVSKRP